MAATHLKVVTKACGKVSGAQIAGGTFLDLFMLMSLLGIKRASLRAVKIGAQGTRLKISM